MKNRIRIYLILIVIFFALIVSCQGVEKYQCSKMLKAIRNNDIEQLKSVLVWANPNFITGIPILEKICEMPYKKTPLQLACYNGNIDMVKMLVDKGADVNYTKINAVYSPLICAIMGQSENDLEIVKYLIDKGANVNYSTNVERPVISWLVQSRTVSENGLEILKSLVDAGADVKYMNYLRDACYWKHNDLIVYFVEECDYSVSGGNIIQQYCRGIDNFSTEIFEMFIRNGADIYETDEYGKSALDYLIETTEEDSYWYDAVKSIFEAQGNAKIK